MKKCWTHKARNDELHMCPTNSHWMKCTLILTHSHGLQHITQQRQALIKEHLGERPISILNPLQQLSNPLYSSFSLHLLEYFASSCYCAFIYSRVTCFSIMFFSKLLVSFFSSLYVVFENFPLYLFFKTINEGLLDFILQAKAKIIYYY